MTTNKTTIEGQWSNTFLLVYGVNQQIAAIRTSPSIYTWYAKLTPEQWQQLDTLLYNLENYFYDISLMLQEGVDQLKSGDPLNIIPPPCSMPPWAIDKSHSLSALIIDTIQDALVPTFEKMDAESPLINVFTLGIILNIQGILSSIKMLVEDI